MVTIWLPARALFGVLAMPPAVGGNATTSAPSDAAASDQEPRSLVAPEARKHELSLTWGRAIAAGMTTPSSDDEPPPGCECEQEPEQEKDKKARLGALPSRRLLGLRYGYAIRPRIRIEGEGVMSLVFQPSTAVPRWGVRAHAVVTAEPDDVVPFVFLGGGMMSGVDAGPRPLPHVHMGAGATWYFGRRWLLRADGRYVVGSAPPHVVDVRVVHGLEWHFAVGAVFGPRTSKPHPASARREPPAEPVAVALPTLYEENDLCPDEPETWNGYQDDDGCPDERPVDSLDEIDELLAAALPPAVEPAPAEPPPLPRFDPVLFDDDDDRLRLLERDRLAEAATYLQGHDDVVLLVTGHADARGGAGYNFDLSLRRAQAVQQRLVELGVPVERVIVHAMSKAEARLAAVEAVALEPDRRVELRLFRR